MIFIGSVVLQNPYGLSTRQAATLGDVHDAFCPVAGSHLYVFFILPNPFSSGRSSAAGSTAGRWGEMCDIFLYRRKNVVSETGSVPAFMLQELAGALAVSAQSRRRVARSQVCVPLLSGLSKGRAERMALKAINWKGSLSRNRFSHSSKIG